MRLLFVDGTEDSIEPLISEMSKHYVVDVAYNGEDGAFLSEVNDYDAIVIDSNLPDINGIEVCQMARTCNSETPILFLTDKNEISYKIRSIDAGADDYLSKPIDTEELKAKLKALLRRRYRILSSGVYTSNKLKIDLNKMEVSINGKVIYLRRREFDILEYLLINKNKVVSKEELLEHVWKDGIDVFSNTVEVHIRNIRNKIDRIIDQEVIRTVRGFGYVIRD